MSNESKHPRHAMRRRQFLAAAGTAVASLGLGGCDENAAGSFFDSVLDGTEDLTRRVQRAITPKNALAREYTEADITPDFKVNGTAEPRSSTYQAQAHNDFADWRLDITGLVTRQASLSLAELRAMPARTQITRHDCVEGWSQIGKWTGARLGPLLDSVGVKAEARYAMFFCADTLDLSGDLYYESIDLDAAHHPQTILAYEMNGAPLSVGHGAPLRLRVERQLGYKMAKYVMRIELVDSYRRFGKGRGGYWEDRGYEWYAGI